jgi:polar amino acid transport system substrate-binding protein
LFRLLALTVLASAGAAGASELLPRIVERGEVNIGVTTTFRPFGFMDDAGKIVGLEIELAKALADFLGVRAKLTPVAPANRVPWLKQGRIDLILATMPVTEERRAEVGIVEPPYYASGVAVLARTSEGIRGWRSLQGRKICGLRTSAYNRVAERYGATIVSFASSSEIEEALNKDQCSGFVFDEATLASMIAQGQRWSQFHLAVTTDEPRPWALAVPSGEIDTVFGRLLGGLVTDWHRSGLIVRLQEKWNLPPNGFLADMQQRYQ